MPLRYLIDGYNVIHYAPDLKELVRYDFEGARDRLVDRIARFCSDTGHQARIVFDGQGQGRKADSSAPFKGIGGLEVLYSPGHLTADAQIERMVYQERGNVRDVVVVSGDRGIRSLCHSMGALIMAPQNFLKTIDECLTRSRSVLSNDDPRAHRGLTLEDRLPAGSLDWLLHLRDSLRS